MAKYNTQKYAVRNTDVVAVVDALVKEINTLDNTVIIQFIDIFYDENYGEHVGVLIYGE
ncbi:hypothetical protein LCGC14_1610600 [marine sediment metagenome]|uniref:Uncharacterized protein n=1 Tax=marine sediment metagenome TaxID=412755 RepID=A0A0F9L8N1_9ZZZZ